MDCTFLSSLLQKLVVENERVCLPGMGSFITEDIPSVLLEGGKGITPPGRRILFRSSQMLNDGRLETAYAQAREMPLPQAREILMAELAELRRELDEREEAVLPGLGTLRKGEGYRYLFVADRNFNIAPDSYGLEPLTLKLKGEGEEKPAAGMTEGAGAAGRVPERVHAEGIAPEGIIPKGIVPKEMEREESSGTDRLGPESESESKSKSEPESDQKQRPEQRPEQKRTPNPESEQSGQQQFLNLEPEQKQPSNSEPGQQPEQQQFPNPNPEQQQTPNLIPTPSSSPTPVREPDRQPAPESGETPEPAARGGRGVGEASAAATANPGGSAAASGVSAGIPVPDPGKAQAKKRRLRRIGVAVLCVAGVLILGALAVYVFRDSLRPWLERMLYSREELEILQRSGRL